MKLEKLFLILVTSFIVFGGTVSCTSSSKFEHAEKGYTGAQINTETIDFIPDSSNVKFLGRTMFINQTLWMSHSSSGVEFNINAKRLDISLKGDSRTGPDNVDSNARIAVFVNGERWLDKMLSEKEMNFTVFDGEENVEGLVQVIKLSECSESVAGLTKISVDKDGKISPAPERKLKIEFIGDSITCGYGIDAKHKIGFSTKEEDNTRTYAYKTAKALDADYSMFCISGFGVISGYTGNGEKVEYSRLPQYYEKFGFEWLDGKFEGLKPSEVDWDFSQFQPDIVVINLGSNDLSYTRFRKKRNQEFTQGYLEFIKTVRKNNPDAYILCTLGIIYHNLYKPIQNAVEIYTQQTGDTNIGTFRFRNQKVKDGVGADRHPTEATNIKAAAALIADIKTKVGL